MADQLYLIDLDPERPVAESLGRSGPAAPLDALPTMTNVALGDPYLAEQLAALHASWEIVPKAGRGLLGRLRTRLAWWLLGPELRQASATHATLTRLIDSLIVQLDQDRAARRRIEEQLAYREEQR